MRLKIYGCRGSVPLSHHVDKVFGGNTSCIKLTSGDYSIALDAGSGLINLGIDIENSSSKIPKMRQDILLSHLHMDHIIGLSAFAPALDAERGIRIFTVSRDERSLPNQIFGAFVPPYWPVSLGEIVYAECVQIHEEVPFAAGSLTITAFSANHPDKTTSFHITDGEKTVVYLLDSEIAALGNDEYAKLLGYCKDADAVVFDAAYSVKDYVNFKGWGHSTVEDGIRLRRDADCKRMIFSHFAQKYNDGEILSWRRLYANSPDASCYILAADEMEIIL